MLQTLAAGIFLVALAGLTVQVEAQDHGIAMHGAPKYDAGFDHLDYVNPDAPKGGTIRLAVQGTFSSLNPFIIKGVPVRGRHLTFESLMKRTWDEPFSLYGLLAESIEVPEDRSSALFVLRPEAKFHDGSPVTVDDVVFSWRTLRDLGRPNLQLYYRQVERVEQPGPRSVRFVFDAESRDRELPLIIGLMPILSKSYYLAVPFDETTMEPPLGSGPYRVETVDPGRSVTYRRDPDYWGRDLPVNHGQHNFDRVRYDYYRDGNTMMEAFSASEYDVRFETSEKRWATAYEFPAVRDGRVKLEHQPARTPLGNVRVRVQQSACAVRKPCGAPCPCACLRLRLGQRNPAVWRLCPHPKRLREFRARLARASARRGAGRPGAIPGPPSGRGLRAGLSSGRRDRRHSGGPEARPEHAFRGRVGGP